MARLTDGNLVLEERERISFPVEAGNPLAEVQRVIEVKDLEDVKDFAFVIEWQRAFQERAPEERRSPVSLTGGLPSKAQLLQAVQVLGGVLQLQLADFVVPAGATVVMQNALNRIVANKVTIQGTLEAQGNLAITCDEIGGA
jgi:hypothetical protein